MSPVQSVLVTATPQARSVETLWWVMFWVTATVFAAVVIAWAIAIVRGRSETERRPSDRRLSMPIGIATGLTLVILVALLASSVVVGRSLQVPFDAPPPDLPVRITGHQWWWQIEYWPDDPPRRFSTANELHLPTGRTIDLELQSSDVIHSFWVPALAGKTDLVPGRTNHVRITIDRDGRWLGQCAEYCGLEHAKMRLLVEAEAPQRFEAWATAQRVAATPSIAPQAARGRDVVAHSACAMCHHIAGTTVGGRFGPDLSHVGSRERLAAGALDNTPAELARWIADPQRVKPGARMPKVALSDADLAAVAAYLESLK